MNITIINAKNPVYSARDQAIELDVLFEHLAEFVTFTACADDPETHGRELYFRAIYGEFGDIAPYIAPPAPLPTVADAERELASRQAAAAIAMAPLNDAVELGIATPQEQDLLLAWKHYRIELMRLPDSDGWPTAVIWPEPPQ